MASRKTPSTPRLAGAPRLYVVTPDLPTSQILEPVAEVVAAVDVILQVRSKSLPDADFVDLARQLTNLCHQAGRICIINDRLDIAIDVGADGVHLGQSDMAVADARRRFDGILGSTCRTPEQAHAAASDGADYVGVGPTFVSSTKPGLPDPLGVTGVSTIADSVTIPTYAIGGITAPSATTLAQTSVYGVAVVSAIFEQPNLAADRALEIADALSTGSNRNGVVE